MQNWNGTQKIWFTVVCSFFLLLAIFSGLFLVLEHKYQGEYAKVQSELTSSKKRLITDKTSAKKTLLSEALESKNSSDHQSALQVEITNNIKKNTKSFFNDYLSYGSGKEYRNRASLVKNIAAENITTNKKLFDSGKDNTGGDIINNLNLNSEFVEAHTTVGIIEDPTNIAVISNVSYSVWKDGQASTTTTDIYKLTYNNETGKITNLELIGTLGQQASGD